ncbi:hypothetical protein GCWU000246_00235 [Jonquetella anthropi E3_33 E1]|nr:hypothetical protein GCWU000246_00235 [Jonquetella anthropi E3_33 E1]
MLKRRSPEGGAQVVLTLHVVWAAVAGGRDSGIKVAGLKGAATTKNEKRKTKNEKRKTKNEKRKTKNEKRKTKKSPPSGGSVCPSSFASHLMPERKPYHLRP